MEAKIQQFTLPSKTTKILVWHQGALGDVLLAGPALQAVAAHYPEARMTLVGGPDQLSLLMAGLPRENVWNAQRAIWLDLFQGGGQIADPLKNLLSQFDLALVFAPHRRPEFLDRFRLAGVGQVFWLPSFPLQAKVPIRQLQAEHLQAGGLRTPLKPFRLAIPEPDLQKARSWMQTRCRPGTPLAALAPGSGHARKNWPLDSYVELALSLEEHHHVQVWWVLGPAEAGIEADLQKKLPHQELRLLKDLPLSRLAATLGGFQLYVGNDSGVTHLAAALGQPAVVAIFGPSDPVIWAPPGAGTIVIASPQDCSPCTTGREIHCPENICLSSLPPEKILNAVNRVFQRGVGDEP